MPRGPLPPLVHKIRCGQRMEALRERAVLSQEEVADRLGWSQQKVANIETAVSGVQPRDLDPLLDVYGVDASARDEYRELVVLGRKQLQRRRSALRNKFDGTMRQVVDMEFSAATVSCHNSMLIPGLLQTEECMRYLFRAHRPSPTPDQIDEYVEHRLGRQKALENTDQQFWFVINEYALLSLESVDGSSKIHHGQVRLLMEAIDRPNVELQVAPYSNGYYPGQAETYRIFGFDTEPSARVTYVEKYDGGDILHDTQSLARFGALWDQQRVHALGPERTRPFLRGKLSP